MIKLHMDSAEYYRICAEITTEDDLIELFHSLSEQRKKMTKSLVSAFPFENDRELWMLMDVLSYLQRVWYHMKLALIINNRQQILLHSLKSEHNMLQEYERVANDKNLPEEVYRQGIYHQQLLKENLRLISGTPIAKFSRQKNLEPAMEKRA